MAKEFSSEWWQNLPINVHDFNIPDGIHDIQKVTVTQRTRDFENYYLQVVSQMKSIRYVFFISIDNYKRALRNNGITIEDGLIDQGDGILIPNIKKYRFWTYESYNLIDIH